MQAEVGLCGNLRGKPSTEIREDQAGHARLQCQGKVWKLLISMPGRPCE